MSNKRSELEAAATEAVQRSGLQPLSFRTLAEQVGVKSSSVHYYFPEKSDLASALIDGYTAALQAELAAIGQRKTDLRGKLDALVDIFDEVLKADKFCLCGMLAAEVAMLSDDNQQRLRDYFHHLENWLSEIFRTHAEQVASELKPAALAKIVISGLEGAILLDRVAQSRERLTAQRTWLRSLSR